MAHANSRIGMRNCTSQILKGLIPISSLLIVATGFAENRLPPDTAIPVRIVHSIDAAKAHPGDPVLAKTLQVVVLPGGHVLAKGATIIGHVVESEPFKFDATPYARQKPSKLSIHFDNLESNHRDIPVNLSVRAIANTLESQNSSHAHSYDDTDHVGTVKLIGGAEYSPLSKAIKSIDGDTIGYNRKNGIYARLVASVAEDGVMRCDGTRTEQSVAIFAPNACGTYGFGDAVLIRSGQDGSGTFTITMRKHSIKIYAGTTALLQVNGPH